MGCRGECLSLPWFCLRKLQIVFSFTLLRLYRLVLYRGARNYETYPLETGKLKEIKLIYTLKVKENMLRKVSREEFLKRYEQGERNFQEYDFTDLNLSGVFLAGVNLTRSQVLPN